MCALQRFQRSLQQLLLRHIIDESGLYGGRYQTQFGFKSAGLATHGLLNGAQLLAHSAVQFFDCLKQQLHGFIHIGEPVVEGLQT